MLRNGMVTYRVLLMWAVMGEKKEDETRGIDRTLQATQQQCSGI